MPIIAPESASPKADAGIPQAEEIAGTTNPIAAMSYPSKSITDAATASRR
jgi:hypothetical protein